MNKLSKSYQYDYKHKYFIISKIKYITNQCKNGCFIKLTDNEIIINAYNQNTILLAYELIKKEIKKINIEKKNEKNIEIIEYNNINNYNILENDSVVDYVFNNNNNKVYTIENKPEKKDKLIEILNNNNLSKEEIQSNKIALELLKEEEQIKNKKLRKQRNRQKRKDKINNH